MRISEETKQGQEWIEAILKQSSSVDVEIHWAENDDWGSPDDSGIRGVRLFWRIAVVTPEGQQDTERIRREDIDDCADDDCVEVRNRVGQQVLGLLRRLGVAK